MRVVFIGPFALYPKGTVAVRILPLARVLRDRGHEVTILLPPYDNPEHSGRSFTVDGIDVHNVTVPRTRLPAKYLCVAGALVRKALRLQPDVVHVFKPKGYSGLAAMFFLTLNFLRLRKVPVVVDSDDWEGHGGFADFFLAHGVYPRIMVDFFDFQEKWLLKHCDVVTVASRVLELRAHDLREGVDCGSVFYVPNGVGELPDVVKRTSAGIRKGLGIEGKRVILLYTRFFEYDVEEVVDILGHVVSEMDDVRLLVVGKGRFGEEEKLLDLAREERLLEYVVYVGWVRPEAIPSYIRVADVAIYPFKDTLLNRSKCPGKLVQLMGSGRAVVADDVGQISEYIENGKSGILVEPSDVKQFSQRVVELLRNRRLRERLGENARKRVWEEFNWRRFVKDVELAYELALEVHDKTCRV